MGTRNKGWEWEVAAMDLKRWGKLIESPKKKRKKMEESWWGKRTIKQNKMTLHIERPLKAQEQREGRIAFQVMLYRLMHRLGRVHVLSAPPVRSHVMGKHRFLVAGTSAETSCTWFPLSKDRLRHVDTTLRLTMRCTLADWVMADERLLFDISLVA